MASNQSTRDALVQLFGKSVQDHEDCMGECVSLCRLYNLSPQDLFYKFEAFALSALPSESRNNPTLPDFRALRSNLQSSIESADGQSVAHTPRRDVSGGWGSGSTARKRSGLNGMGIGKLFGGTPNSVQSSGGKSGTSFGSIGAQQTPSRPSALSRGSVGGGRNGLHTGDDSMDLDDSPSRGGVNLVSNSTTWTIQQTLNSQVAAATRKETQNATTSRVKMMQGRATSSFPSRYMFERGAEKGEALDDRLDSMSTVLIEAYALNEEDLSDPSLVHQESVYVVGRICPNLAPPSNASKKDSAGMSSGLPRLQPTPNGILIESSKLQGAGQRVPIWLTEGCVVRRPPGKEEADDRDLGPVDVLGMFPGMIVGLKGRNGGGSGFGVEEVLLLPSLPPSAIPPSEMLASQYGPEQLNGGPMEVVVAAGPYTSDNDLDFLKWHALMDNIERDPVDVVILMGPFLALNHPLLPTSTHLPAEHFKRHFASRMNRISPSVQSRTSFVLVPSVLDSLTSHAAWPQPPYEKGELGLGKGIRALPNPALFSIGGIVVGASTADVLRDIRSEELARRVKRATANGSQNLASQSQSQKDDVVARAIRHVLSQRSFYPVFPPPQPKAPTSKELGGEAAEQEGVVEIESPLPLSLPHSHLASFTTVTPEVLILPSISTKSASTSVKPFARNIDETIVLNPGSLSSSSSGDDDDDPLKMEPPLINLAKLTIRPLPISQLQDDIRNGDESRVSSLWTRCRVDLLRL